MPNLHKPMMILEFDRIREMLAKLAPTEGAAQLASVLKPRFSQVYIEKMQHQTTDAKRLIGVKGMPVFDRVHDVTDAVRHAQKGAALSPAKLLDVAGVLRCAAGLCDYFQSDAGAAAGSLEELFELLEPNRYLERDITRSIFSEDTIADEASAALADIRRKINHANAKIRELLQK